MVKLLGGGGLQGVAAPPCLKEIIYDGNKISNWCHSLFGSNFAYNLQKTKQKQTKQNKKQNKKHG